MNTMHARGDNHRDERALEPHRESQVRVMEENRDEEQDLKEQVPGGVNPEHDDLSGTKGDREDQLSRMEAQGRRGVQVAVDVVDEVKAPEPWHAVSQPMPVPERVVEEQDTGRDDERGRQLGKTEQTDAVLLGPFEERRQERRLEQAHHRKPKNGQHRVAAEVPRPGLDDGTEGMPLLQS